MSSKKQRYFQGCPISMTKFPAMDQRGQKGSEKKKKTRGRRLKRRRSGRQPLDDNSACKLPHTSKMHHLCIPYIIEAAVTLVISTLWKNKFSINFSEVMSRSQTVVLASILK